MDTRLESRQLGDSLGGHEEAVSRASTGNFIKTRLAIDAIKTFGIINVLLSIFWFFMLSRAFLAALTRPDGIVFRNPRFILFLGTLTGFYALSIAMTVVNVGILRWHEWARQALSVLSLVLIGLTLVFHLAKRVPVVKIMSYNWPQYLYLSLIMSFFNITRVKRLFAERREQAAQDSAGSVIKKSIAVLFFCSLGWHLTWNAITCRLPIYRIFLAGFLVFVLLFMNLLVKPRVEK